MGGEEVVVAEEEEEEAEEFPQWNDKTGPCKEANDVLENVTGLDDLMAYFVFIDSATHTAAAVDSVHRHHRVFVCYHAK